KAPNITQALKLGTATSQNDEQQKQLLPKNRESDVPSQEGSVVSRESTVVVDIEQECQCDDKRRISLSDLKTNSLY
ncbi:unnamed protein product, partial [Rotaria sp. Silwood1]